MYNLKRFDDHSEYSSYISGDPTLPNVSYCYEQNEVHYSPYVHDYRRDYLTFEALESGTFKFSGVTSANTLQYSLDDGETWTTLAHNTDSPTIDAGSNILWKGSGLTIDASSGIGIFSSTGTFNVKGNIMSLHFGDDFSGQTSLNDKNNACQNLFNGCTKVISAENLSLPATTLASWCYGYMFEGCTSLTTAPVLPATTLVGNCYRYMFSGCTSLTTAPALPATTLDVSCYDNMFDGCTSLTTAPELPATTLVAECYQFMFHGCTSLATAPSLPATALADNCYGYMFDGCRSLTTAPVLPATALTTYCYQNMFQGCTSLTTAPALPATTLASSCYNGMFSGCTSLTTAPELPARTLKSSCYKYMFNGCSNLNYIKAMFTTTPGTSYTSNWVSGVKSTGTYVKNSAASYTTRGVNAIPSNWTLETASS